MLSQLDIPPLQERRRLQRLSFMYKVVKGQVPAVPIDHYLIKQRPKRNIRAKQFKNCVQNNIVENYVNNNSQCFQPIQAKTDNFKNSFFVRTILDWNKLNENSVNSGTLDSFRLSLSHLLQ